MAISGSSPPETNNTYLICPAFTNPYLVIKVDPTGSILKNERALICCLELKYWRRTMRSIHEMMSRIPQLLVTVTKSKPLTQSFRLDGEKTSRPESEPPQWNGNWQKQENAEQHDAEKDAYLHELMENVKRYIRKIDVSRL